MSHIIGYARTSTVDQVAGYEAQQRDLDKAGCTRIFKEQTSGADADRPELARALDYLRDGDVFVVTKIDRLARNTKHLLEIVETIETRKASLRILDMGLDTGTPNGRLMLTMLGAIGQFEREMMLERQREGIAKAKADGKYTGRKPMEADKVQAIKDAKANGMAPARIAREFNVARSTVYRVLAM
ncbi:recombinase family protein [Tropicibacter sp. R16_0]|uniref:recombinase family protein n=1 Tax=Tropicibacter sp. R16_0 TaxID=2821102 RepID=UPI001ADB78E3|nr:recombinase family protein [Tropicibacter sp. R16_0]MBO9452278.1 recombinase family protein [Tropicibacter sp. R16_0]